MRKKLALGLVLSILAVFTVLPMVNASANGTCTTTAKLQQGDAAGTFLVVGQIQCGVAHNQSLQMWLYRGGGALVSNWYGKACAYPSTLCKQTKPSVDCIVGANYYLIVGANATNEDGTEPHNQTDRAPDTGTRECI